MKTGMALCKFTKPLNDPSEFFVPVSDPCRSVEVQATAIAQRLFQQQKDSLMLNFDSLYLARCLEAQATEKFYVQYLPKEYYYTLYYYDQAGNLVKTMPQAAVKPNFAPSYLDSVVAERKAGRSCVNRKNNENLATRYRYNSLNQVAVQQTPDGGISKFWYDRLGRLTVSQNAKQVQSNRYSYTLYDEVGRITEVGQVVQPQAISQSISREEQALAGWLSSATVREEITATVYDRAHTPLETILDGNSALFQKNLRNRVSYTYVKSAAGSDWDAATFYSYDIHGNVDTLLQDYRSGMGALTV